MTKTDSQTASRPFKSFLISFGKGILSVYKMLGVNSWIFLPERIRKEKERNA